MFSHGKSISTTEGVQVPGLPRNYGQVYLDLKSRFGTPEFEFALRDSIWNLSMAFPSPGEIQGIRLLDIGCGCCRGANEANSNRQVWDPWLCRAVQMLGGNPVGIDIGSVSPQDTFEFHQINLLHDPGLARFESGSFDAVNCTMLFSSPHLVYALRQSTDQREALKDKIAKTAARLLKAEGKIICFDPRTDKN